MDEREKLSISVSLNSEADVALRSDYEDRFTPMNETADQKTHRSVNIAVTKDHPYSW